jgi:hypothetical protein
LPSAASPFSSLFSFAFHFRFCRWFSPAPFAFFSDFLFFRYDNISELLPPLFSPPAFFDYADDFILLRHACRRFSPLFFAAALRCQPLIYAAISLPIFHAFAAASFRQALRRFRYAIAAVTPLPPHAAYASADFHAFAAELFLFAILFSPCRFSVFHFHAAAIAATPHFDSR